MNRMRNHYITLLLVLFIPLALYGCSGTSSDSESPLFAGAKELSYIGNGPIPELKTYRLSWDSAEDSITPRDRIVYILYRNVGTTESIDYAELFMTTTPGVLSIEVGVSMNEIITYFAVRASDEAGNIDSNTSVLSASW